MIIIKEIVFKDYQQETLEIFKETYENKNHKRFYFSYKMGLGKTLTSLQWFKNMNVNKFFIVTQKKLLKQWVINYHTIFKNDKIKILNKSKDEEKYLDMDVDVFVCTYEKFKKIVARSFDRKNPREYLRQFNIILDESQVLKNYTSGISKTFQTLQWNNQINWLSLLSGSAFSNDPEGFFTQYILLVNHKKTSFWKWVDQYFVITRERISYYNPKIIPKIQQPYHDTFERWQNDLKGIAYFKNQDDLFESIQLNIIEQWSDEKFNLNEKQWSRKGMIQFDDFFALLNTPSSLSSKVRQSLSGFIYGHKDKEIVNLINNFNSLTNKGEIEITQEQSEMLDKINSLERNTYFYDTHPKFDLLVQLLNKNDNYLIFYNYEGEKDIITIIGKSLRYNLYFINGNQNDLDKILTKTKLEKTLIIAQSTSASTGIDGLQKYMNKIIHYSLPYSHEIFNQANARLFRIGQDHSVDVYCLMVHDYEKEILTRLKNMQVYNDLLFYHDIKKDISSKYHVNLDDILVSRDD